MKVKDLRGRLALVTGAGSGIGRATAVELARRGADLAVCDVHGEGLRELESEVAPLPGSVLARRVDVSSREAMQAFADEVHRGHEAVDILVNNAGVAVHGGLLDTTPDDWDWIVGINLTGVALGCSLFIPPMVRRGRGGHVVNVASSAAFIASPAMTAYAATKFGVAGLSEALRAELRPHRIGVSTICPGIVATGIAASMRSRGEMTHAGIQEKVRERFRQYGWPPERVARAIVRAIASDRAVVPVGPEAYVMRFVKRLSPALAAFLVRHVEGWMLGAKAR